MRAALVGVVVLLSAYTQANSKTLAARDTLCAYFEAVLREAPTGFVALRGKSLEGYGVPVWEGKLKPPSGTRCQATDTRYVCSLGFRPDKARGKREFDALALRALACFPGWRTQTERTNTYWIFVLSREKTRVGITYERLDSDDGEDRQPELWLNVHIVDKQVQ
ncbi:MAG: hypothetical protein ACRD2Q_04330 [Terriglobales bacterium]